MTIYLPTNINKDVCMKIVSIEFAAKTLSCVLEAARPSLFAYTSGHMSNDFPSYAPLYHAAV